MARLPLSLVLLVLIAGSGMAANIPYVFVEDPFGSDLASCSSEDLENIHASSPALAEIPSISSLSDEDVVEFSDTGGGETLGSKRKISVGELKEIFNSRVEPDNSEVHREGLRLASRYPGYLSISQICSVYEYLKKGDGTRNSWSYVQDPRGRDYYSYANETLAVGRDTGCSGVGDCDDFAILMSALIESIGGTTRIVLAYDKGVGHAYTEVYLGRLSAEERSVETIIVWLKQRYNADEIFTHIDSDNKDVWLNLDWGTDFSGDAHPGSGLFRGDQHIIVSIRDDFHKIPLNPPAGFRLVRPESDATLAHPKDAMVSEEMSRPAKEPPSGAGVDDWINQGIALNNEGMYEDAVRCYEEAIELDPSNYPAWELKGLALRSIGRYQGALECFDRAIGIDPAQDYAWRDKGELLYTIGLYQEAVICFDRAIQIQPCASYWNMKGEALMALGRHAEASDAFVRGQMLGEYCA